MSKTTSPNKTTATAKPKSKPKPTPVAKTKSAAENAEAKARPASKSGLLTTALSQSGGATIEHLCELTGWQSHSVRAAMTGFKKKGVEITRTKTDGKSIYAIVSSVEVAQ